MGQEVSTVSKESSLTPQDDATKEVTVTTNDTHDASNGNSTANNKETNKELTVKTQSTPKAFNNYGLYNVTLMVTTEQYMAARTSAFINLK